MGEDIKDEKEVGGSFLDVFRFLDDLLKLNISTSIDITRHSVESRQPDYPLPALQQLVRNALMHRNYEGTNAPVRIYWFDDRIEIHNPGGPFGQVTRGNFGRPGITDYRNPNIAEAMKSLGYVQKFGYGIQTAQKEMKQNGNPLVDFFVEDTYVVATCWRRP